MIRFEDVHKRFGTQEVLRGVSFEVPEASVQFVLGQSGAGKSVLIKLAVGLLRADAGRIFLGGREVTELDEAGFLEVRRDCQMIFQHATLFEALTVLENVAMPVAKRFRVSRREAQERAHEALAKVHAEHLTERLPSELGAGVRKRVAIARALALRPRMLLYDEPTTGLDPVAARRTDRLIKETAVAHGLTSIVVSHDLASVRAIADRVVFLGDGVVRFSGSAAELFSSRDSEVGTFVRAGDPTRSTSTSTST